MSHIEILLIATVVAVACALPGVFLVLRRMALMGDAISHAILPGIVLAFFLTHSLSSPLLILAAAGTGVFTVIIVELLQRTKLVKEDAAIGLTFPALFSIGVILISRFAGNVHLDIDAVLLGELAYAHLNRLTVGGVDLGPVSLYVMGTILVVNLIFIFLFYKELKLVTFDSSLAASLGFAPAAIHYGLMTLVSVTTVGAFDAVGSILVVALIVGPAATAYLMTDSLARMLLFSGIIGSVNAVTGYWLAHVFDVSIAGAMATMTLVIFGFCFLVVPGRGLIAILRRRHLQKLEFAQTMLVIHLLNHEALPEAAEESLISHLHEHLRWEPSFASQIVKYALGNQCVSLVGGTSLALTARGRGIAQRALVQ